MSYCIHTLVLSMFCQTLAGTHLPGALCTARPEGALRQHCFVLLVVLQVRVAGYTVSVTVKGASPAATQQPIHETGYSVQLMRSVQTTVHYALQLLYSIITRI